MSDVQVRTLTTKGLVALQFREDTEIEVLEKDGVIYYPATQFKEVEKVEQEPEVKKGKKEKPEKPEKSVKVKKSAVEAILTDFDAGEKTEAKAVSALVDELGADKKAVQKLLAKFDEDEDSEISDYANKFEALRDGGDEEEEEEEEEKPVKNRKTKAKKEELVEVDELEKGDRVSVYWSETEDEEFNQWFDGTVVKIKGESVVIKYDVDDSSVEFDPDYMIKIKRLEE